MKTALVNLSTIATQSRQLMLSAFDSYSGLFCREATRLASDRNISEFKELMEFDKDLANLACACVNEEDGIWAIEMNISIKS
jgi:hypothetical protein